MQNFGLKTIHNLKQRRITDYIRDASQPKHTQSEVWHWLNKNKSLPRTKLTCEVDILGWRDDHWGALSIEQKTQVDSQKTLAFDGELLTLHNGSAEFKRSASDLYYQCAGAGYLSKAFLTAMGIDKTVLPVGVVDYAISIGTHPGRWAFHNGVLFVNRAHFDWFLGEFVADQRWVRDLANMSVACT
jgi:hypothetical protein